MMNKAQKVILYVLEKIKYKSDLTPDKYSKETTKKLKIKKEALKELIEEQKKIISITQRKYQRELKWLSGKKIILTYQQDEITCNINIFGDEFLSALEKLKEMGAIEDFQQMRESYTPKYKILLPKDFNKRYQEIKDELEINLPTDPDIIEEYLNILDRIEKERQRTPKEEPIAFPIPKSILIAKGVPLPEQETSILRIFEQNGVIEITETTIPIIDQFDPYENSEAIRAVKIPDLDKFKNYRDKLFELKNRLSKRYKEGEADAETYAEKIKRQFKGINEEQEKKEAFKKEIIEEIKGNKTEFLFEASEQKFLEALNRRLEKSKERKTLKEELKKEIIKDFQNRKSNIKKFKENVEKKLKGKAKVRAEKTRRQLKEIGKEQEKKEVPKIEIIQGDKINQQINEQNKIKQSGNKNIAKIKNGTNNRLNKKWFSMDNPIVRIITGIIGIVASILLTYFLPKIF